MDSDAARTRSSRFEAGLERSAANYAPLTPLVFLDWAADVYPERAAVVHGARRYTWRQTRERCRRLASALVARGVRPGDTVAVLAANTPELYEAHFGVPMTGAVLAALNTRLDASTLAFLLEHGEASVFVVDREFAPVAARALSELTTARPLVVSIDDPEYDGAESPITDLDYETLLAQGDPEFRRSEPLDEWQAITLNYTSGTTGNPKGVVYHHRGAHLNALSNIVTWGMPRHSVYLWTLPMFHCNGWCFPWTVAANAGTNVCLRRVTPRETLTLIRTERVTHYCGAPIVHSMILDAPPELREGITHQVSAMIAAAPPPQSVIEGMEKIGIELTHVYGLTEVYGPSTACAEQVEWTGLDAPARARLRGRQGVRSLLQDVATVIDPSGSPVPWDGATMGEIVFRGNITMKGYLKNPTATAEAFGGGVFHSGDLAVVEPDGYIKIKDRAKDIIISGGENISSVEVEDALYRHPSVAFCAVVATPDERWGETPQAYVELKPGAGDTTESDLIAHCRSLLPHFKAPRHVVFTELPKTSTGKIQKHVLRTLAHSAEAIDSLSGGSLSGGD